MSASSLALAGPVLLLLSLSASQLGPFEGLAQPMTTQFRHGTQAFRRIVERLGFTEPLTRLEDLHQDPASTLLIVLGDTAVLDKIPDGLAAGFLRRGGVALIASDRASSGRWADLLNVRISGQFVRCDRGSPADRFQNLAHCPLVRAPDGERDPLFQGIDGVATNNPSYLEHLGQFGPECRAVFPPDSDRERKEPLDTDRQLFAVGWSWGPGKVLVLADHSVFINDMLLRTEPATHNIRFAANCLVWLRGGTPRHRVLFVEDGNILTNFQEPLSPPLPPPEALIPFINGALRSLEEEDAFNGMLKSVVAPSRVLLGVLAVLTLFLVGYGFVRLGKKRHRTGGETPRLATLLAREATSAAVVELRHRAMLEEGNLWEAARALARQCFDGALGESARAQMTQLAAEWGEPPRVKVAGWWWRRWQVGQEVRRLWQLAYDPVPVAVSQRDFTRLAVQARAVRAALDDGSVRIEPP